MPRSTNLTLASILLAVPAAAQLTHFIPNGTGSVEANSSNAFPWGRGVTASLQIQTIYDSSNFTAASINFPILITRLRWRPNGGVASTVGGSYTQATVEMASATVDAMSPSTTFAANMGLDRTLVYSGPVVQQVQPASTPGNWFVDIPLTTPFAYDPSSGNDLIIFSDIPPGVGAGVGTLQIDVQTSGALSSRVYNSTAYGSGTGFVDTNHGVVVELTYVPTGPGFATFLPYGVGCPALSSAAVYELFAANQSFDLANSSLLFIPNGNGSYTIVPGPNSWYSGFTNNLALSDNSCAAVTLPFPFPHAGGSAATISVSSNGFLWLGQSTDSACCAGSSGPFVTNPMGRIAACWMDLNPAAGGGVFADLDTGTGDFVVTWNAVTENSLNPPVTMQIALQASGLFEIRYRNLTNTAHVALAGYASGGGTVDPGSSNLSSVQTTPILSPAAATPIRIGVSGRPILGTSVNLVTASIPTTTLVGATFLSFVQHNPGIDLTPLGATACSQYVNPNNPSLFVGGAPTSTLALAIPNLAGLAGLHLYSQSVTITPGVNALGLGFSNGIGLVLDVQ